MDQEKASHELERIYFPAFFSGATSLTKDLFVRNHLSRINGLNDGRWENGKALEYVSELRRRGINGCDCFLP